MADRKKIVDWQAGEQIIQPVVINVQQYGATKTGGVYIRGNVSDSSGTIAFISFASEVVDFLKTQPQTLPVKAWGSVQNNNYANDGSLQLKLECVGELPSEETLDLLPRAPMDSSFYMLKLEALINEINKSHIRNLLSKLLVNDVKELYIKAPAAMKLHHAYIGGLLEHSVDVAHLAKSMALNFESVDKDIVIAGALLHDIGKIYEISPKLGFEYTLEGNLLGHIMLGTLLIEKNISCDAEFAYEDKVSLLHIILSHHGEKEKGSSVECKTRESFIVHYADEISTIMNQFDIKDNNVKNDWRYVKFLNRSVRIN